MRTTLPVVVFLAVIAVAFCEVAETDKLLEEAYKRHEEARIDFNVYSFTSTDYPAMFAIFAGLIIVLALALAFIIAGMVSMDPGKDSIIYRMTTTRMKKD